MAKLKTCDSCGGQVANNAYNCPHCGAATGLSKFMALLSLAGTVVIVFMVMNLFREMGAF